MPQQYTEGDPFERLGLDKERLLESVNTLIKQTVASESERQKLELNLADRIEKEVYNLAIRQSPASLSSHNQSGLCTKLGEAFIEHGKLSLLMLTEHDGLFQKNKRNEIQAANIYSGGKDHWKASTQRRFHQIREKDISTLGLEDKKTVMSIYGLGIELWRRILILRAIKEQTNNFRAFVSPAPTPSPQQFKGAASEVITHIQDICELSRGPKAPVFISQLGRLIKRFKNEDTPSI
jgi:hypothetical protein